MIRAWPPTSAGSGEVGVLLAILGCVVLPILLIGSCMVNNSMTRSAAISDLHEQSQQITSSIPAIDARAAELRSQLPGLQAKLQAADNELAAIQRTNAELGHQVAALRQRLDAIAQLQGLREEDVRVDQKRIETASSLARLLTNADVPSTGADGARTYTVQAGDTLTGIARNRLGSRERWTEIKKANPGLDITRALQIGQVLRLPDE